MLFLQHVWFLQHRSRSDRTAGWAIRAGKEQAENQEAPVKREDQREIGQNLTRRERQIMDILFERGSATASEIQSRLPDPPGYSAVRAALRVLERKGRIRHEVQKLRYVWTPRAPRDRARRFALRHLVRTFFEGKVEEAVAALLDEADTNLDEGARERLRALIEGAGGQRK
jgi:BlaI family transcriptional regulator, penicillinase repressor